MLSIIVLLLEVQGESFYVKKWKFLLNYCVDWFQSTGLYTTICSSLTKYEIISVCCLLRIEAPAMLINVY